MRGLVLALLLAACSHPIARQRTRGPACSQTCRADQVCFLDGDQPVGLDNPRCQLAPVACAKSMTCACLVENMRASVCDESESPIGVTLYRQ